MRIFMNDFRCKETKKVVKKKKKKILLTYLRIKLTSILTQFSTDKYLKELKSIYAV